MIVDLSAIGLMCLIWLKLGTAQKMEKNCWKILLKTVSFCRFKAKETCFLKNICLKQAHITSPNVSTHAIPNTEKLNRNHDFSLNIELKSIVWLKSYIVTASWKRLV